MSPSPDRRLRVLLLFGGQSAEHDVSRTSAVAVARALDPTCYDVVPVAITREGRWLLADRARAALETGQWPPAFEVDGAPVRLAEKRAGLGSSVVRLESGGSPLGPVDVAFPLLHGPYGEDGVVAGRGLGGGEVDDDGGEDNGCEVVEGVEDGAGDEVGGAGGSDGGDGGGG